MGTQALVSIVRKGETMIKCVAGCNGGKAKKLAQAISERQLLTAESVHAAAAEVHYGCIDCTVTQDKDHMLGADVEELVDSLYTSEFGDPQFNPRWGYGTASYVFLVDADTWQIVNVHGEDDEDNE